jgi:hypothetical protein
LQKQRLGDVPEGFLIAGDKDVEIFGQKWWRYDTESRAVSVVANSVPWYFDGRMLPEDGVSVTAEQRRTGLKLQRLGMSNHYGLLVQCTTGDSQWPLYQICQPPKK